MSKPILTIAIPTYNRCEFLDTCLQSIYTQSNCSFDEIEIIVSDNASLDNTAKTVEKYSQIHEIFYIKNEKNLGPDLNILQCFEKSTGKYVWIFGDDDFLLPGALNCLINLVKSGDFGSIHLSALPFAHQSELDMSNVEKIDYIIYKNPIDYFEKVHYFVTFITGNIVNSHTIDRSDLYRATGSNLVQLGWIIPSIFGHKDNAIVETPIIAVKSDNTGGYKLITTFSKNFNSVLRALVSRGINEDIINIINDNLLKSFFPVFIRKKLYETNNFENESGFKILMESYWNYSKFWKNIFPIYGRFFVKGAVMKSLKLFR